jgi:hypothetical protein
MDRRKNAGSQRRRRGRRDFDPKMSGVDRSAAKAARMVKRCGAPRDGRSAGYCADRDVDQAASTITAIARWVVTDSPVLPVSTVIRSGRPGSL